MPLDIYEWQNERILWNTYKIKLLNNLYMINVSIASSVNGPAKWKLTFALQYILLTLTEFVLPFYVIVGCLVCVYKSCSYGYV